MCDEFGESFMIFICWISAKKMTLGNAQHFYIEELANDLINTI